MPAPTSTTKKKTTRRRTVAKSAATRPVRRQTTTSRRTVRKVTVRRAMRTASADAAVNAIPASSATLFLEGMLFVVGGVLTLMAIILLAQWQQFTNSVGVGYVGLATATTCFWLYWIIRRSGHLTAHTTIGLFVIVTLLLFVMSVLTTSVPQ